MGLFIQVLKLACVGALWGLGLSEFVDATYAAFAGLLLFYLLLVIFTGGGARGSRSGS